MLRRQLMSIFSRFRPARLPWALAGLGALVAIAGPLANTVASARGTASARADATAVHTGSSGSPAATSIGPRLAPARSARRSPHLGGRQTPANCPWLNQSLPLGTRVNMLLSHMSLADKVAEMYINEPTTTGPDAGYEGFV
jgi:hypothetical protein